jgi:hypothetical protein
MGELSVVFSLFGDSEELTKSINVLESVTSNSRRSEVLIADFSSGFAKGWNWAVTKHFATALDITLSSRVVKGKPSTEVVFPR